MSPGLGSAVFRLQSAGLSLLVDTTNGMALNRHRFAFFRAALCRKNTLFPNIDLMSGCAQFIRSFPDKALEAGLLAPCCSKTRKICLSDAARPAPAAGFTFVSIK